MLDTDRLKTLMDRRELSQAELARRVGLKQNTVNQLVNGVTRSTTKMPAIARELRTTVEYLEGLTDDPSESFSGDYLTEQERNWVDLIRAIGPREREAMITVAESLAHGTRGPTLHDKRPEYRAG